MHTYRSFRLAVSLVAGVLSAFAASPISLHPANPHYFQFRGKTIVLITSGEHYGAVMNAPFDYRRYLDTLASDGLNYTRLFGGSYIEIPGQSFGIKRNDLAPDPANFIAPWLRAEDGKFDLEKWNPAYFARYRDFLAEASKRGIVVEITLFSSTYQEAHWKVNPFYPANNVNGVGAIGWKELQTLENGSALKFQERYVRKLVREANSFDNVIFEIQNEPWSDRTALASVVNPFLPLPGRNLYPNSIDLADDQSLAWQGRVADWITTEEGQLDVPNRHLIAQNYSNFGFPVRKLAPGVSMVNFHYAYPAAVESNYGLGKAIGYDETGFLGRDDLTYCRQAWNFMLSGGSAFDGLDYSFSVGHEDGSDTEPNGPGGGSPTLRRELGILSHFLNAMPLSDLSPNIRIVKHAPGLYARALSSPRGEYAIYFDGDGPATIALNLPAGAYSGQWVDVVSGATTALRSFNSAVGVTTLDPPEFHGGIALHMKRLGPRR